MHYTLVKKVGLFIVVGILLFFFVDIACPVETIIGIPCPGCGMTTAIYYVLHLDFKTALYFHPLVFVCIGYLILVGILYLKHQTFDIPMIKRLTTVFVVLLLLAYGYRMLYVYPNYPMPYNEQSILGRILY